MALLPSAIEETLRYRSPFQWVFRAARRDVELHGQTIPAESLILVMLGSANRDERQFGADADEFEITRHPNSHVAFGQGIHVCLGAPLSRMEARIGLGDVLTRLRGLQLASAEPWEPRKALHVHGPTRLVVRYEA
jgi:cytochrome P450